MVHVMAPRPSNPRIPVFFNIDSHVGPGKPNKADDVRLVQFCFKVLGTSTLGSIPPALKSQMASVRTDGTCDSQTCSTILEFQKWIKSSNPGTVADGIVSPSQGQSEYGSGRYTIVELNGSVKKRFPEKWPMLGQIPHCTAPLAAAARVALVGDP